MISPSADMLLRSRTGSVNAYTGVTSGLNMRLVLLSVPCLTLHVQMVFTITGV